MRKFVIDVFRKSPFSTGIMLLLIAFHIMGIKDLRTPMMSMSERGWYVFLFYILTMSFFALFILPKIEQPKREKQAWWFVVSFIVIVSVIAKIFVL